jgi:hypothetical protein
VQVESYDRQDRTDDDEEDTCSNAHADVVPTVGGLLPGFGALFLGHRAPGRCAGSVGGSAATVRVTATVRGQTR